MFRQVMRMPAQTTHNATSRAPRYDAVEILMLSAGVFVIVAIAFLF
jgi:hypothetical protein